MSFTAHVLVACALALPAQADALRPAPPLGCGNVTDHGVCNGSIASYCDTTVTPNVLITIDCEQQLGRGAQCLDDPQQPRVGCQAVANGPCLELDASGNLTSTRCTGDAPACVQGPTDSACTPGVGTCGVDEIGTCFAGRQALILGCLDTQPWLLDCTQFGATCGPGVCVDAPEGAVCNTNVLCAAGLQCGRLSRCELVPVPDAGVVDTGPTVQTTDASRPVEDAAASPDSGGGSASTDASGGHDVWDSGSPDATSGAPVEPDAGTVRGDAAASTTDAGTLEPADSSSCGCATTTEGPAGGLASILVVVGLAALFRRRR